MEPRLKQFTISLRCVR